jgi:hypothetical protein
MSSNVQTSKTYFNINLIINYLYAFEHTYKHLPPRDPDLYSLVSK